MACTTLKSLKYRIGSIILCAFLALPHSVAAQQASEYQLKAAFLVQFANYVEWPADSFIDSESEILFGVINSEELADNLELMVLGKRILGREMKVQRLNMQDSADGVHVLFVGVDGAENASDLLGDTQSKPILTVTQSNGDRPPNSVINFEVVEDKVRFDVSLITAEQNNLKVSSRLLQVAQRVID